MFRKMSLKQLKTGSFLFVVICIVSFFAKDHLLGATHPAKPGIPKKNLSSQLETDENAISILIKGRLGEIQKCYDQQLSNGLSKSGTLVVKWLVNEGGSTSDFTEEKNELASAEIYQCATEAIGRWKFPKGKSTYIRHSFHLKEAPRKTAYIVEGATSVTVEK